MGVFKKKAEIVEPSEETQKLLDRIKVLEEWIRQKQSDVNLGWISAEQYFEDIAGFKKELAVIEYLIRGEVNENSRIFDDLMGKPMELLDEIMKEVKKDESDKDSV